MANFDNTEKLRAIIRELISESMNEMPGDGYVDERKLTPAEEKKKEELVKALKSKYGKTPKTYAIATAQAKKLAEKEESVEEKLDFTSKFDDNPALTKGQKKLPDQLQKGIISKKTGKDMDEIRNLSHNAKRVAGAKGKENLPYHAPISANEQEEGVGLGFVNKTSHGRRGHEDLPYHAHGAKK